MKQTVLIADGDAELCDLCRRFFMTHGYDAETSFDGLDCLAKLLQLKPDVLVLDQSLHWRGAGGVFASLGKESLMPGIPVILLGTAGSPRDFADFIDLPIVDYLPKPFTLIVLVEKVRSVVAKQGQRGSSKLNRDCPELLIG
jgi:DNA-binding response OmpR family regulator